MRLISLTNGGTILISRGVIEVSTSSEKGSRADAVSTGFRMNQLRRPRTLNFAVIVNILQSSGFP